MQSVHASARTLSHTNLIYRPDASLASNTDVSTRSPPLICPSFQRAHVPRVLKRLGTSARQVASSDWVCKSCSNRFLAGAQKVWDEGQKLRAGGQNAKKGKRGVTAQWFHFNSRKSLNVSLQEGIPGVDEYLRVSFHFVFMVMWESDRGRSPQRFCLSTGMIAVCRVSSPELSAIYGLGRALRRRSLVVGNAIVPVAHPCAAVLMKIGSICK